MNFDASSRTPTFAVPHVPLLDDTRHIADPMFPGYSLRARQNVQAWRAYLPTDCINSRTPAQKGSRQARAARDDGESCSPRCNSGGCQ